MKQKLKRFMAGFMAMLTLVGTLFTNGTTAFAASPQANIAFWNASVKNSGEVSELKPGFNHGKILYSILDGNSAYCMNFGLRADGGQLMNSYDDASTSMSAQQRKLLSYCLYYGFNSTQKAAPSNSQCDEYIATQAMVWVIVADIFGTGSGDSAARKLCNTAPSPDSSYSYYERLRDNISSSYNATLPSFASRRTSEAPTYELKWNEGSQRFETTLYDSNGVLSDFDFGISGYSVDKNGNSITISSTSVNTTATTGTFTSNAGKVETTSSCVFWLTGKSGYQEFISERPTADPVKAYIKVKTENIGYGELTKTDESSGVKLSGAVYGIYSDSGCTNRVQTMTTDGNGYAKSAALVAGTYYVKEITAPKGYVLSGKVHTLTVKVTLLSVSSLERRRCLMPKKNDFKLDVVSVRLVKDAPIYSEHTFNNPADIAAVMGDCMCQFDREVVCVVNLRSDLKPINVHFASVGSLNEAMAHPRELFKSSILSNAASMMLIHCHPSGNVFPSKADTMMTDRMNKLCELMGIPLIDHIIVGGDNREFFSFREKGMIDNPKITLSTDYRTLDIKSPLVAEQGKAR